MRLLIRADASEALGFGHFMRCLVIAQEWVSQGGQATFLSRCDDPGLIERSRSAGVGFQRLGMSHPHPTDLHRTLHELSALKEIRAPAPWLILDGYHFDVNYHRAIRRPGNRLLVVDDHAHLDLYSTDILLNQNIDAPRLRYRCSREAKRLLGLRYALLRPEFRCRRPVGRTATESIRRVLVTCGGADPENVTCKVIQALRLSRVRPLQALVVVGGANTHLRDLEALVAAANADLDVQLVLNPNRMAELMEWADMAITAGGSTCWELCYMGLPSLILVLAENQLGIAQGLDRARAAVNLGDHGAISSETLARRFSIFAADSKLREELVRRSRALVDGHGVSRVLKALQARVDTPLKDRPLSTRQGRE